MSSYKLTHNIACFAVQILLLRDLLHLLVLKGSSSQEGVDFTRLIVILFSHWTLDTVVQIFFVSYFSAFAPYFGLKREAWCLVWHFLMSLYQGMKAYTVILRAFCTGTLLFSLPKYFIVWAPWWPFLQLMLILWSLVACSLQWCYILHFDANKFEIHVQATYPFFTVWHVLNHCQFVA